MADIPIRQSSGNDSDPVDWTDSGWIGAGPDDKLDQLLAAEEETIDRRLPHIMTALGPIEPSALGVTMLRAASRTLVGSGTDLGQVALGLERLHASGVRSMLELAPPRSAQEADDLAWVTIRSPIQIIVAGRPADILADDDLVPLRYGAVSIDPATTAATSRTMPLCLPSFLRLDGTERRRTIADGDRAQTMDAGRVTIVCDGGHVRSGRLDEALDAGFRVGLVVPTSTAGTEMVDCGRLVSELVARGYGDRVLVGYRAEPVRLFERFPLALMETGLSAVEVRRLFIDNPLRALLIEADESGSAGSPQ